MSKTFLLTLRRDLNENWLCERAIGTPETNRANSARKLGVDLIFLRLKVPVSQCISRASLVWLYIAARSSCGGTVLKIQRRKPSNLETPMPLQSTHSLKRYFRYPSTHWVAYSGLGRLKRAWGGWMVLLASSLPARRSDEAEREKSTHREAHAVNVADDVNRKYCRQKLGADQHGCFLLQSLRNLPLALSWTQLLLTFAEFAKIFLYLLLFSRVTSIWLWGDVTRNIFTWRAQVILLAWALCYPAKDTMWTPSLEHAYQERSSQRKFWVSLSFCTRLDQRTAKFGVFGCTFLRSIYAKGFGRYWLSLHL